MKNIISLALALVLAGCAAVSKVPTGETVIKNRLSVTVDDSWNQFEHGLADNVPTWTKEGVTVDALKFYVGFKDGEVIAPTPRDGKGVQPLVFKASMQPADVVALYESLHTRDGSSFALEKLEPASFADGPGFRFEYSVIRKQDDVRMRGVAFGTVRQGQLFLISYAAPRLGFFPKYAARAEALMRSAKLKS